MDFEIFAFIVSVLSAVCFLKVYIERESLRKEKERVEPIINEYELKKSETNSSYSDVMNNTINNQAFCSLVARYEKGINEFPSKSYCYLYADNENLKIVLKENPEISAVILIDKITEFKGDSNKAENNNLIIKYTSRDKTIKELIFEYNATDEDKLYNKEALNQNNIFNFVNSKTKKENITINL